jgi:hypothetical protein
MVKPKLSVRPPPAPVDPDLAQQFIATGNILKRSEASVEAPEHLQTSESVSEEPPTLPPPSTTQAVADIRERLQTSVDIQGILVDLPKESPVETSPTLIEVQGPSQTSVSPINPHMQAHPNLIPLATQASTNARSNPQTSADVHRLDVEPRPELIPPATEASLNAQERLQTSMDAQRKRAPKGTKVLVAREGGRFRRRMTVYLEPALADEFMAWCSNNGREASHAVGEAIAAFLATHRKP